MLLVFIFLIGFFIGNILEWFAYNIPKEKDKSAKENIRKCYMYIRTIINKRILISFLIGLIYCLLFIKYKVSIDFFRYISVFSILFIIAVIDLNTKNVYFSTTFTAMILSLVFVFITYFYYHNVLDFKAHILGALIAGSIFSLLAITKKMGWGDVELFIICGLLVGIYKAVVVATLAVAFCGVIVIYKILINKEEFTGSSAFGPYIVMALLIVIIL